MSIYSIRALTMENEFTDLVFVGKYVDDLVKRTGDLGYSIVYEWGDDGPGDWPPVAVLARLDGRWWRRQIPATGKRVPSLSMGIDVRSYEVTPRPAGLGAPWKLTLFQNGEEAGGGVFPDYDDAVAEGESWASVNDH